ncbi:MAG: ribosome maturation factor RimP [Ruminococcaceae bacterium]|nr:ribosome maturation factor RimP [Oscillospiraceae bacterium]
MADNKVTQTVFEIASPIALANNCFVDDVEFKKEGPDYVLRVIIDVDDEKGGVSIDQCEAVSKALSDILDEKDPITQAYMLEVSSPGIDRELKKDKDFERFAGRDVDVKLYKAINGQKIITAKLLGLDNGIIKLESGKETLELEKSSVASVRLAIIW